VKIRDPVKKVSPSTGVIRVITTEPISAAGEISGALVNPNIRKLWTVFGITIDCPILLCGLQRKSPRGDIVPIPQCENETLQSSVGLVKAIQVPLHWSESAEDVPVRVQNHGQSVRVSVAAAVKFTRTKTVAAAAPQKRKPPSAKLSDHLRKV
jgi:hypothetical protein